MSNRSPLSKKQLRPHVHQALKQWHEISGRKNDPLSNLLLVQQAHINTESRSPAVYRLATNQVLLDGIETLERQDALGAQVLRRRFLDGDTILMAAPKLQLSEDQLKRRQRKAIRHLAEIIWEQETAAREAHIQKLQANLMPASYAQLFGVSAQAEELATLLQSPDAPHILALVGLGGIGKTALADAAVRHVSSQLIYDDIIWLRVDAITESEPESVLTTILSALVARVCPNTPEASHQTRLRQIFKKRPYLIIIDNLESEADTAYMVDVLRDLADPSKFLLTSRSRLPAGTTVHSIPLGELPPSAAAALIRHQAQQIDLPEMAAVPDDVVAQIMAVTGGNPLALKLVIGLSAVLPLPQILADLTAAKIREVEEMYRHIYWQAWRTLDKNAQAVLKMMPLAANVGVTPEQLTAMTSLSATQLWPAIATLVSRSLLEARGTPWERRYGIHQLTDSFLRTEIIHWPADA